LAVSTKEEFLDYYEVGHPAANTFSTELLVERNDHLNPKKVTSIKAQPLQKILDEFKPAGVQIDFLNVDVEGFDLKVLQSNDWNKFRPTYILVEDLTFDVNHAEKSETLSFLSSKGYSLTSKCGVTLILKLQV
jgi:FkbM family methyltransferase